MRDLHLTFAAPLLAVTLAACGGQARGPEGEAMASPDVSASLIDTTGARVGVATFSDSAGSGWLAVSVTGLSPGAHGMHIHENGACTPPGFESAGGHFNPEGKEHGTQNPEGPHAGDLPNIVAQGDGSADTALMIPQSLLGGGAGSIAGATKRALVIHADPDDEETDPSGNSGARVVCGVIERS